MSVCQKVRVEQTRRYCWAMREDLVRLMAHLVTEPVTFEGLADTTYVLTTLLLWICVSN